MQQFGRPHREHWTLDPAVVYLNNGSFGATPRQVQERRTFWSAMLEEQPVRFMTATSPAAMQAVGGRLSEFLGAGKQNVGFVTNATEGVNAVLRSVCFDPESSQYVVQGDGILTTSHCYGAVRRTIDWVARVRGAKVQVADVPFPIEDPRRVVEAIVAAADHTTRLAVIDHVTSATGLVFPIAEIVEALHDRGIPVLVDGAHAPGMLPLELDSLGADWYTGNCHKWMFAPKGCAFLAATDYGSRHLHPTVLSHGLDQGFHEEFGWTGTRDPAPWLSLDVAMNFAEERSWDRIRTYNKALAAEGRALLQDELGLAMPAPLSMLQSLVTFPVPFAVEPTEQAHRALHDELLYKHSIEIPTFLFGGKVWLRISAQIYNDMGDYEALVRALRSIGGL